MQKLPDHGQNFGDCASRLKKEPIKGYYLAMRKPIFPRILLLLLLYLVVFTVLVSIQFSKPEGFTNRAGSFVITGQYRISEEEGSFNEPNEFASNEYIIEGDVHVLFGGIDFCIVQGADGRSIYFITEDGAREEVFPERMIIMDSAIHFAFPGGTGLDFTMQDSWGAAEMRIAAVFADGISGIELPFVPQRRTGIRNAGGGQFIFRAGRVNYTFGLSQMDAERRVLLVEAGGRPVSYRAIPDGKALSPSDFILPQAENAASYAEALKQWRDDNYSLWSRIVSSDNNEDVIMAMIGEAFSRGNYGAAVAAVPQAFLRSETRSFESSAYLGNLVEANRTLSVIEREKYSRLSRLINEKSYGFLLEPGVFEYLTVRGHNNLINAAFDLVDTIDTSFLALDIIPGIFEGFSAWRALRGGAVTSQGTVTPQGAENPFERIVDEACQIIFQLLRKTDDGSGIYVFNEEGEGLVEFNLRLGKALLSYAELVQNVTWEGIGRSLILSALSMEGSMDVKQAAARLYRILNPVETLPRAISLSAAANNAWTWTTAVALNATQQNDVLNIAVTFPVGETHYMIIRGIRPFSRIQLYNMDFRTDPQFERYDSSGWSYIQQDQALIVKMKHRETVENIRIIFREAPRPVVVPETVDDEDGEVTGENAVPGLVETNLDY